MPMVAWYMLSKESYMNRVIKEVLPTRVFSSEQIDGAHESGCMFNYTTLFAEEYQSGTVMSAKLRSGNGIL